MPGLSDEQLEDLADRVLYKLQENPEGICDALAHMLETRFYEWLGRKILQLFLLLAGSAGLGAWLFVRYLEGKGVI